jgi:hypothetical protein
MADLRSRFIEDYAGGLLNISRQEVSTTGEVLSQDGLTTEGTIFVEDGSGVKSGLKLGISLVEVVDPTTEMGAINVRYGDRTYAKIRDLRIFTTAIASAQSALSEATSVSISNLETAFQLLEDDVNSLGENLQSNISSEQEKIQELSVVQSELLDKNSSQDTEIQTLSARVTVLEKAVVKIDPEAVSALQLPQNSLYYSGVISISGGNVTGVGTTLSTQLAVGDIFVAEDNSGVDVEFQVVSFDTDPAQAATKMSVVPTNKTVVSKPFKKNVNAILAKKINEIISALKTLDIFV